MKVLTLKQPEATAIILGLKKTVYRGKHFSYRGPLLIHAACRRPGLRERRRFPDLDPDELPYSAIIGMVDMLGCVRAAQGSGYEWYFANPRSLARPFPCTGRWRIWEAPSDFVLRGEGVASQPEASGGCQFPCAPQSTGALQPRSPAWGTSDKIIE